jgi:hypothetical protein
MTWKCVGLVGIAVGFGFFFWPEKKAASVSFDPYAVYAPPLLPLPKLPEPVFDTSLPSLFAD